MSQSFVILFHTDMEKELNHLDLLLELHPGGPLASWRLAAGPEDLEHFLRLSAQQQPDHRREYLTYEGPVSNGRGTVRRVDEGTVTIQAHSPDRVDFTLIGQRLRGKFTLHRVETDRWELRREKPHSHIAT